MKVLIFEDKTSKLSFPYSATTITKLRKKFPHISEKKLFKKLVEHTVKVRWQRRTDTFHWKTLTSGYVKGKRGFKTGLMKVYIENTGNRPKASRSRNYQ